MRNTRGAAILFERLCRGFDVGRVIQQAYQVRNGRLGDIAHADQHGVGKRLESRVIPPEPFFDVGKRCSASMPGAAECSQSQRFHASIARFHERDQRWHCFISPPAQSLARAQRVQFESSWN